MTKNDYRGLSDGGLAHVVTLERRVCELQQQVTDLRAALAAKVDTNPAASPIDHEILSALRADLEAARVDVENATSCARRERSRSVLLYGSLKDVLSLLVKFTPVGCPPEVATRFDQVIRSASELLTAAEPYMK